MFIFILYLGNQLFYVSKLLVILQNKTLVAVEAAAQSLLLRVHTVEECHRNCFSTCNLYRYFYCNFFVTTFFNIYIYIFFYVRGCRWFKIVKLVPRYGKQIWQIGPIVNFDSSKEVSCCIEYNQKTSALYKNRFWKTYKGYLFGTLSNWCNYVVV